MNFCKDCQHSQRVDPNAADPVAREVRLCQCPSYQKDGKSPSCIDARRANDSLKTDCPEWQQR